MHSEWLAFLYKVVTLQQQQTHYDNIKLTGK